jgi:phosphomethylpyrimidine synthase
MKITQDVREYAAKVGVTDQAALEAGMKEKAEEFKKSGGKIYQEVASSGSSAENAPVTMRAASKD